MKRLLLIGLVGLSLVGCSNDVDSQTQEVTSGDAYRQEMKERRLQRYRESQESPERKEALKKVDEYNRKFGCYDDFYVFEDGSEIYMWHGYGTGTRAIKGVSVLVPAK